MYSLILFILSHATFLFGELGYRQKKGIAMGSSLCVVVANCFMSIFLQRFLAAHPDAEKVHR